MLNESDRKKLAARLNRIEGQVRGISRMIDDGAYCTDVLHQISAAQAALGRVGDIVLENHLDTCVSQAFQSGNERDRREKIEEVMEIFQRYRGSKVK
jgi:DNA-binding FrmR family transcriptional regulator